MLSEGPRLREVSRGSVLGDKVSPAEGCPKIRRGRTPVDISGKPPGWVGQDGTGSTWPTPKHLEDVGKHTAQGLLRALL